MSKPIPSNVIALVFNEAGHFQLCSSTQELRAVRKAIEAGGETPSVFYREGHDPNGVRNINTGGGFGVQAGTIHGGVSFR